MVRDASRLDPLTLALVGCGGAREGQVLPAPLGPTRKGPRRLSGWKQAWVPDALPVSHSWRKVTKTSSSFGRRASWSPGRDVGGGDREVFMKRGMEALTHLGNAFSSQPRTGWRGRGLRRRCQPPSPPAPAAGGPLIWQWPLGQSAAEATGELGERWPQGGAGGPEN